MVQHIIPELDVRDIGYYSGMIASAQFFGRMLSSYMWGYLADRFGRKSVLIISGTLLAMATLGFGFSVTFLMALILRFLVGLFNGISPTAKAAASELSDDSTQSFIMNILGSIHTLGLVIGPSVSGFLADPIKQYGIPPVWILVKFPYMLPGIMDAIVALTGVVVVYFFMEETRKNNKNAIDSTPIAESEDCEANETETQKKLDDTTESKTKEKSVELNSRGSVLCGLLTNRIVMLVLVLNSVFSVVVMSVDEVTPLWAELQRNLGGLDMSMWKYSMIISISTLAALPFNLSIFQMMNWLLGTLRSYHVMLILLIPLLVLVPSVTAINSDIAVWILFGVFMFLTRILISGVTTALLMFTSNSVTADRLGAVNGLSTSLSSLFRTIGPIYSCSVFSASLRTHLFPFDYHFIFILNSFILVCCVLIGSALPKSLNHKMKIVVEIDGDIEE